MSKGGVIYLFFGDHDEYSLHPLYEEMVARGYNCEELLLSRVAGLKKRLIEIKSKYSNIVFITSAHLFLDRNNMDREGRYRKENCSALEIIDFLKPCKKVYYPHDLLDGFTHFDKHWFSQFDVYLSPLPVNYHGARFCKVVDVGWIKKRNYIPVNDSINFGHGFSESSFYFRQGSGFMYEKFKPIWEQGVKIKFSDNEFASDFVGWAQKYNFNCYEPSINIFEMIDHCSVVVTNSVTGVNVEAALSGRMVINILDGVQAEAYQRSQVGGLPNVYCLSVQDGAKMIADIKSGLLKVVNGTDIMKPFDFKKAIAEILI